MALGNILASLQPNPIPGTHKTMFGHNTITGKKFFNKANEVDEQPRLLVTSIFYTFQGEGPFQGRPALFIRLAKCNLTCSFCDAYFEEGDWMTTEEILSAARDAIEATVATDNVKEFVRRNVGMVVTGGEPMLQENLTGFLHATQHKFAWQQIETNGTQNISALPKTVKAVVSPKCLEKNGAAVKYLEPHPSVLTHAAALKFVVTADASSPYHTLPEWVAKTAIPVYVSPMNIYARLPVKAVAFIDSLKAGGTALSQPTLAARSTTDEVVSFWEEGLFDRAANQANHEYAAKMAVANGFIFNLQGHLYGSMA